MSQGWGAGGYGPPPSPGGYGPPPGAGSYGAPAPMVHSHAHMPTGLPRCPTCGHEGQMLTATKISTGGWVVFVVLLLGCFPLCWIGLLMKSSAPQCPKCRNVFGQFV